MDSDFDELDDGVDQQLAKQAETLAITQSIRTRLADKGVDFNHCRLPLETDSDYHDNDYDLWQFLSLDPLCVEATDVKKRTRSALLEVHPGRTTLS